MSTKRIILSFLCLLFLPASANACSCAMPDDTAVDRAQAAIIGTVLDRRPVPGEYVQAVTTVRVERSNSDRLDVGDEVEVWSGGGGGDCGLELDNGVEAGLLLGHAGGKWSGSLCGTTSVEWMEERIGRPRPGPVSRLIAWVLAWLPGEARSGIVPASGCATPTAPVRV